MPVRLVRSRVSRIGWVVAGIVIGCFLRIRFGAVDDIAGDDSISYEIFGLLLRLVSFKMSQNTRHHSINPLFSFPRISLTKPIRFVISDIGIKSVLGDSS